MIKKLFILLLFGITTLSYAENAPITKYEDQTIPEISEQLRSLDITEQINQKGELDVNSQKVTNLATPTASTDATTKAYVDTTRTVAQGGTGATTLTDGGVLLGSGTGAITAMAVLADGEIIVGDGTTDPVAESGATARTSLGLTIGTNVQAYDAQLDDLADGTLSGASTVSTGALTGTVAVANGGTNQTTTGLAFGGKVVTYEGDGNDDRTVAHALGRTPILVVIAENEAVVQGMNLWMTGFGAASREFSSGGWRTDAIKAVDGTNVTVGTNTEVNQVSQTYCMFVM